MLSYHLGPYCTQGLLLSQCCDSNLMLLGDLWMLPSSFVPDISTTENCLPLAPQRRCYPYLQEGETEAQNNWQASSTPGGKLWMEPSALTTKPLFSLFYRLQVSQGSLQHSNYQHSIGQANAEAVMHHASISNTFFLPRTGFLINWGFADLEVSICWCAMYCFWYLLDLIRYDCCNGQSLTALVWINTQKFGYLYHNSVF